MVQSNDKNYSWLMKVVIAVSGKVSTDRIELSMIGLLHIVCVKLMMLLMTFLTVANSDVSSMV